MGQDNIQPHDRHHEEMGAFYIACLVVLASCALRFYKLGSNSLWYDEIQQAWFSVGRSPWYTIERHWHQAAAPLDPLLTGLVSRLGHSEYLLRFPAAFLAVLTVALCLNLGRHMFGLYEGLVAALLLSLSAFHIEYSQELRTYSLLTFLGALALSLLWRAQRDRSARLWMAWSVVGLLGVLAHTGAVLFVLAQAVYVFLITANAFRGRICSARAALQRLVWPAGGASLAGTLTLVRFMMARGSYVERLSASGRTYTSVSSRLLGLSLYILREFGNGRPGYTIYFLFALGALITVTQRDRRGVALLALSCLVPGVAALTIGLETFNARYVIFVLVPYLLLVARGITGLAALLTRLPGPQRATSTAALALAFGVVMGLGGLSVRPIKSYYAQQKEDWRGLGVYLMEHVRSGDVIIADGIGLAPGRDEERAADSLRYYFPATDWGATTVQLTQVAVDSGLFQGVGTTWAVVFDPDDRAPKAIAGTVLHHFTRIVLVELVEKADAQHDLVHMLRALIQLQTTPRGALDAYLALARAYSLQGNLLAADAELLAAQAVAPQTEYASRAINTTANFISAQKLRSH